MTAGCANTARMLRATITNNWEFMKKMLFAGQHTGRFCRESVLMTLMKGKCKFVHPRSTKELTRTRSEMPVHSRIELERVGQNLNRNSNLKNKTDENGAKNHRSKTLT